MIRSKVWAFMAFVVVLVMLVLTYRLREQWWMFIDMFFLFIAAFMHLMAVAFGRLGRGVTRPMDAVAGVCLGLGLLAFLVEFILFQLS